MFINLSSFTNRTTPDPETRDPSVGKFEGTVQCEWQENGKDKPDRMVKLLQPFAYIDSKGKHWTVPAGTEVNGASIPRKLWPIIGSPYVGNYRRASVVHDYFCLDQPDIRRKHTADDVHWMFYDACRTGGVPKWRARPMYWAVKWFGPHWEGEHSYWTRAWFYLTRPIS